MSLTVAAFYQFASFPDFRELREPLRALGAQLKLKGSVLLAHEGINGTLAGDADSIAAFIAELGHNELFNGRLNGLELKFSSAEAMPFGRLKVRLKKEIVTLGDSKADPRRQVGIYVEPAEWNALIASPASVPLMPSCASSTLPVSARSAQMARNGSRSSRKSGSAANW